MSTSRAHKLQGLLSDLRYHIHFERPTPSRTSLRVVADRLEQWARKQEACAQYADKVVHPILAYARKHGWKVDTEDPDPLIEHVRTALLHLDVLEDSQKATAQAMDKVRALEDEVALLRNHLGEAEELLKREKQEHQKTLEVLDGAVLTNLTFRTKVTAESSKSKLFPGGKPGDFITKDGCVNGKREVYVDDPLGDDVAQDVNTQETYHGRK